MSFELKGRRKQRRKEGGTELSEGRGEISVERRREGRKEGIKERGEGEVNEMKKGVKYNMRERRKKKKEVN